MLRDTFSTKPRTWASLELVDDKYRTWNRNEYLRAPISGAFGAANASLLCRSFTKLWISTEALELKRQSAARENFSLDFYRN